MVSDWLTLHDCVAEEEFLGVGVPDEKSVPLLFVSVHPPPALKSAVVLLSVGAGLVSEQFAVFPLVLP
jgi:hypothetical protein